MADKRWKLKGNVPGMFLTAAAVAAVIGGAFGMQAKVLASEEEVENTKSSEEQDILEEQKSVEDLILQAKYTAAVCDFDGAIEILEGSDAFADNEEMQQLVQEYTDKKSELDKLMKRAAKEASQYNYDKAIKLLQSNAAYGLMPEMREAAKKYQQEKDNCVSWSPEQVTHVFYHTLIVDTAKAFDGDYKTDSYNRGGATVEEFNKITQSM